MAASTPTSTPATTPKAAKAEKKGGKPKREKLFHPDSRKAHQLTRTIQRKTKMADAKTKRTRRASNELDKYAFFFHAMPPPPDDGTLSLSDLHALVRDVWLTRHDALLAEERAARRKGRPPSTKEQNLQNLKVAEAEEYRTGLEVPDLTHPANVALFRQWDQLEVPYIDLLRFIRINSEHSTVVVVSRPGKHFSLAEERPKTGGEAMDTS